MINCTELETYLVDFLDGKLAGPELASVREHLEQCPSCTAAVASYKEIQSAYRDLPEEDVSEEVIAAILGSAAEREFTNGGDRSPRIAKSGPSGQFNKRSAFIAMAASILAVAFLAWNGKRDQPDFDSLVRQGQLHRDVKEWGPAIEDLTSALDLDAGNPRAAEVVLLLAELHLSSGDATGALDALDLLNVRYPEQAKKSKVYLLRGDVYQSLGKHDLAQQTYEEGLEAYPDAAEVFKERTGQTYLEALESLGYIGYID